MSDTENILPEDELNEEQLLNYLKGNLPEKENHAIEERMMDSDFVNDSIEGLQSFSKEKDLNEYVKQLNKNLHHQLEETKHRKEKRKIKGLEWGMLSVAVILTLCFLAYTIIMMMKR